MLLFICKYVVVLMNGMLFCVISVIGICEVYCDIIFLFVKCLINWFDNRCCCMCGKILLLINILFNVLNVSVKLLVMLLI